MAGSAAVLILIASVDKARYEGLCVRRHLAAVDRVEDVVLVAEERELAVLADAPALGVRVTHRFAVVARIRHPKRELLAGGSKVCTSSEVESFNFGKRSPKRVLTKELLSGRAGLGDTFRET